MKWIQSNGGPLVLVPESSLAVWHGVEEEPGHRETHYDRACSVTEDIATLHIGHVEILVLGDEPFLTTWIPREGGVVLLRWIYANGEQPILDFLSGEPLDEILKPSGIVFHAPENCVMFDSAEPGAEIQGDFSIVPLFSGHYDILTGLANPTDDLRLLFHQLVLKQ